MKRTRITPTMASALSLGISALLVTGCGGNDATTATRTTTTPTPATGSSRATSSTTATVKVADTKVGRILVDSAGRTLYQFTADVGKTSACTGACAAAWPPLLADRTPAAGAAVDQSLLGTSKRSDGTAEVTYNGHPLYLYIQDRKPGDISGQGLVAFGAPWYVVSPSGGQITASPTTRAAGSGARTINGY